MALVLRPVDPIPVLGAVIAAIRRITARYRLTPQEKRNLNAARGVRAAVFTASIGGRAYRR
ncbi:hypothetical protein [Nocardia barduliensis]|uniref:hypothetical protein n=1 Tax=Nocardia barduliensis TaxID=2736643 RepID=UPI0015734FF0|nr:hypothetical protein [Nocardia barduliensis]